MKPLTLRKARTDRGWTQEQLVARARKFEHGITQSHISKIERGEIGDPSNSIVAALEKALGVPRGTLVFGRTVAA